MSAVFLTVSSSFTPDDISFSNSSVTVSTNLHSGDVILRDSKGLIGTFFRNLSQTEKKYSHAGFIRIRGGKIWVCHYIDQDNGKGLKLEELKDFVDRGKCNAFAVYRFDINQQEEKNLDNIINASITHPLPFDSDFDLKTDNSLYCTEWIAKSLFKSSNISIPATKIAGLEYFAPDNLYINTACKQIYQSHNYKVDLTMISMIE